MKVFLHAFILIICSLVTTAYGQDRTEQKLMQFLIENEAGVSPKDSKYLFKKELLGKETLPYGIYAFGIQSAHSDQYLYLKENGDIAIVPSLKLVDIMDKVTEYFAKYPEIPFNDKIKYYKAVLSLIEGNKVHPWTIEPEEKNK